MWEKKQDDLPEENKDPEELLHISDLNHLSGAFLIQEDTRTLLWVCISALLLS